MKKKTENRKKKAPHFSFLNIYSDIKFILTKKQGDY